MRTRNNRYLNEKQFDIFPYESLGQFFGRDYKGYPTGWVSVDKDVEITSLKESEYLPLLFGVLLMISQLSQISLADKPRMYSMALLPQSELISKQALAKIDESTLAVQTAGIGVSITSDQVLSGELQHLFGHNTTMAGQGLIDIYGEGFEVPVVNVYSIPAIEDKASGEPGAASEFVTTADGMCREQYRQIRKALYDYIIEKMVAEHTRIGGDRALRGWYSTFIHSHKERLLQWALDRYWNIQIAGTENNSQLDRFGIPLSKGPLASVTLDQTWPNITPNTFILNEERDGFNGQVTCFITKSPCNVFVECEPCTWKNIENIFEDEIHPLLKGWLSTTSIRGYVGNPLLSRTDPCAELCTPLSDGFPGSHRNRLNFAVGFSKAGLRKYVSARKAGKPFIIDGHKYH